MSRRYWHCEECHLRMRCAYRDADGGRLFRICPRGHTATFLPKINGMSKGWPREIYDQAVGDGVLRKVGDRKGGATLYALADWDAISSRPRSS